MNFFKTIRFRLTFTYVFVLLLSLAAVSLYFYYGLRHATEKEVLGVLDREFEAIGRFIVSNFDQKNLIVHELNQRMTEAGGLYPVYYALFDRHGNILAKTESFAEDNRAVLTAANAPEDLAGVRSRGRGYAGDAIQLLTRSVSRDGNPIYFLQLGISWKQFENLLWKYLLTVLLAVPFFLLVASLGGYFLAAYHLRPLTQVTAQAQAMTLQNLEQGLPIRQTGDELDQLVETFNGVFRNLAKSYQKIAQFTQDASHELRIPITTLKGEAQVVLDRERDPEEYRKVIESSIEEYDRLMQMLNDLLLLSRSDRETGALPVEEVDLSALLRELIDFFSVFAGSRGILIDQEITPGVCFKGNRMLLERLFSNLLDNAIKYSFHSKFICVTLTRSKNRIEVVFRDQGIGIPRESLGRVFDRFYRVDKSRAREWGGSGLGLSIAKMAADFHSAQLQVTSEEGKGTEVRVIFPEVDPSAS